MMAKKASIIVGGHMRYDKKGRIQKGTHRIFYNYLYSYYNVVDIIHIDGSKVVVKARDIV